MISYESKDSEEPLDADLLRPLGNTMQFAAMMDDLITATAPPLFAIVREVGERSDGWVLAWGLEIDEGRADVVDVDGVYLSVASPEAALSYFTCRGKAHIVRYTRNAAPGTVE